MAGCVEITKTWIIRSLFSVAPLISTKGLDNKHPQKKMSVSSLKPSFTTVLVPFQYLPGSHRKWSMSRIPGSCGSSAAPPCHHCAMQKGQSSERKWIFQAVRQYGDNLGMLFFKFTCSWNIRCHALQEIRLYVKKLLVYLKSQICRYTVYYVN